MSDIHSLLIVGTILGIGGMGLFMYKSDDEPSKKITKNQELEQKEDIEENEQKEEKEQNQELEQK